MINHGVESCGAHFCNLNRCGRAKIDRGIVAQNIADKAGFRIVGGAAVEERRRHTTTAHEMLGETSYVPLCAGCGVVPLIGLYLVEVTLNLLDSGYEGFDRRHSETVRRNDLRVN
jgi:hypothetical protein